MKINFRTRLLLLLLELVDVAVTEEVCVTDQFLTIEAGHHSVLQRFFVAQKLTEYCAKLQVVFAQVAQFKHLA